MFPEDEKPDITFAFAFAWPYTDALQEQSTLRDNIKTVQAQIQCLEQIFTLTLVTLPPTAPQTNNTLLEQTATEISAKKKIWEMVKHA